MMSGFLIFAAFLNVSGFGGADVRSANITRGTIVNPESIQSFSGGLSVSAGDAGAFLGENTFGGRVWTCNHLTAARDHQMKRCFNETDSYVYFRNRYEIAAGWRLMSEAGPCWVLYRQLKDSATPFPEVEWRVRQELETPWVTPYYYLRHTFKPYSLTYWQTGVKRGFAIPWNLKMTPFGYLDWGDDKLFAFKYGESRGHLGGGVSAIDIGVRFDYPLYEWFGLWLQTDGYWIVNGRARAANRDRSSVTSRNEIAVISVGMELKF